ncbi:hypothetical protein Acid345_3590 [Candidatus Koribacter versatilis Ellin345]|uniref:Uncharacterized protein n=1 Tax=Koribacter versatilis (strain Ellin345) TaxID=204669 RepID=Q1IKK9_KORVE|nr:hypothetical protein [Candidatus Koribacter versatilis]ABF42591.1 hypothetical protein Acid345_3590 [Candidatus Koribacter versatilis Ellin345]
MSHHIARQVHEKFKVFTGELDSDGTIGKLAGEVAAFVNASKIAPKSIGIVFLESSKHLLFTLGYRDDEESYPISLHCVHLGKVESKTHDFQELEKKLNAVSSKHRNVICHELYVADGHSLNAVIMTHEAS